VPAFAPPAPAGRLRRIAELSKGGRFRRRGDVGVPGAGRRRERVARADRLGLLRWCRKGGGSSSPLHAATSGMGHVYLVDTAAARATPTTGPETGDTALNDR
jgi:hypothetical protein